MERTQREIIETNRLMWKHRLEECKIERRNLDIHIQFLQGIVKEYDGMIKAEGWLGEN